MSDYGRYPEITEQQRKMASLQEQSAGTEEKGKEILRRGADLIWEAAGLLLKENLEGVRDQARRQTEMLTKQTEMLAEQEKTLNLIEGWCGEEKAELRREKESCEERLKKEFDERERELSEKLKSLENKIQEQIRQIKEMNDREETYKKELHLLKGGSSGRDIYTEFLKRNSLPYCFRMDNYEAFIISVCSGGIDRFYEETMKEKFGVGASDEEKEGLEYILDKCIDLHNRIYPEEKLRRQEEEELIGEEYKPKKHDRKEGSSYGTIRNVILRGILSADGSVRQKSIVEVE